ncbi:interleukin-13 receptor subunit alpha-2 [Lampris incognitus]|uniref:interleukin-13 receptor subunit alpha-2 n=1 Tax=Lampris incognitus TaxID=2546036 RepID=UPI0024B56134|nr:interleukin-13 receptor subunit alpha-2 [Lampris incognitus]
MIVGKLLFTVRATLMLLLLDQSRGLECQQITVDPPEDVMIFDPGQLGFLQIHWKPPLSLLHATESHKRFQLEYFNTFQDSWTAIRTTKTTYSALFDLTKEVRVRVYTLLKGPCTNGLEVMSSRYTEVVKTPVSSGVEGTMVQNFTCIFHKMEYIECNWEKGPVQPVNSQQSLYYWHMELGQVEECPEYIVSNGVRHGCNFTWKSLPDFTDINFCVNGSSPEGPLLPAYLYLQIQNYVKPASTKKLYLQTDADKQLKLHWEDPDGRVPRHCLQWEVEHSQERTNGSHLVEKSLTREMMLTKFPMYGTKRNCFRVRCQMHKYCATDSFWSDWSQWTCHINKKKNGDGKKWNAVKVMPKDGKKS